MFLRTSLAAAAAALVLVACGGGDDPAPIRTTSVKVVGDSLNDSGTFGIKFTVQGTNSEPSLIWTDRVTAAVGAPALCPRYVATTATNVALNPTATSCTSYGVGGGRVNVSGTAGDDTPFSIIQQLEDVAATGSYGAEELLLVDGGGNDAADLVGAYLAASSDNGASYVALLSELLTPLEVQTAVGGGATGLAAAGNTYMAALANLLADTLTTQALNKGAQRIVVITAPDVTVTPRFLGLLALIGQSSPDTAATVKALANSWVVTFNTQLKNRLNGNSKVAVVDFYAELNKWVSEPTDFGLTNATTPACPTTGTESGLPTYSIATCTATLLSTPPFPTGETTADWWNSYVFSDNFHGTPRTNELMGQLVTQALDAKGWR